MKDKSKSYSLTRHDGPDILDGRCRVSQDHLVDSNKAIDAKNTAVKDYCENSEFRTFTDDPKATIYNLRAMAFASGWEACMFHYDLITRMSDDNQIPVVRGSMVIDPPIKIPQDPNIEVVCHNCQAGWMTTPSTEFKCLNCGATCQSRLI